MDTASLRENLRDREKAHELAQFFVEKAVEEERGRLVGGPDMSDYIRFYTTQLATSAEHNVNVIFEAAESPIELDFLNSLHLCFIKNAPVNVYFRASSTNHIAFMDQHIAFYEAVDERYDEFRHRNPNASLGGFLRKAKHVFREVEGYPMPASLIEDMMSYLVFGRIFVHNYFHLTIQARLPEIRHDGRGMRPDLFVWVPTVPALRIAVECDGYEYHKDRQSFTRDRQRDRILQAKGIQVLRFSGLEIYHRPHEVAFELFDTLTAKAEELSLGPRA